MCMEASEEIISFPAVIYILPGFCQSLWFLYSGIEQNKVLMSFDLFFFYSKEIIVLGTGARIERIDPSVLALLKRKGIAVEVLDTVKFAQCLNKVLVFFLTA